MIQDTLIPVLQTRYWKIKIAAHGFPVCLIQLCFFSNVKLQSCSFVPSYTPVPPTKQ